MAEGRQTDRRYAKRCNSLRILSKLILLISRERDRDTTHGERHKIYYYYYYYYKGGGTETFVALNYEDSEAVTARPSGKVRLVAR